MASEEELPSAEASINVNFVNSGVISLQAETTVNHYDSSTQAQHRWTRLRHAVGALSRLAHPEAAIVQQPWQIDNPPIPNLFRAHTDGDALFNARSEVDFVRSTPHSLSNPNFQCESYSQVKQILLNPKLNNLKLPLGNDNADFIPPSIFAEALEEYRFKDTLFSATSQGDIKLWQDTYKKDIGRGIFDIITADSTINSFNKFGLTMIHIAAQNGDCKMLSVLLKHGADPHIAVKPPMGLNNINTDTALDLAVAWRHAKAVSILLHSGKYDKHRVSMCLKRHKQYISEPVFYELATFLKNNDSYSTSCCFSTSGIQENTPKSSVSKVNVKQPIEIHVGGPSRPKRREMKGSSCAIM